MKNLFLSITLMVIIFFSGCASSAFDDAKKIDEIWAYKKFIAKYPDSEDYTPKAKNRIEQLYFYKAKSKNTIKSYSNFLKLYPVGKYTEKVKYLLEDRIWDFTIKKDTYNYYKKYLNNYPYGRYSKKSKGAMAILLYDNILDQYLYIKKGLSGNIRDFDIPKKYRNRYYNFYFTKRDITLISTMSGGCRDVFLLGTRCTTEIYVGKVLKNDMIYKFNDGDIRTLHKTASFNNLYRYSREAYGSPDYFKKEKGLSDSDLYTKYKPSYLAKSYHPTEYSKSTTNWKGGLFGFIQENPIASLAIGAVAVAALAPSNDNSSSDYSSEQNSKIGKEVRANSKWIKWKGKVTSYDSTNDRYLVRITHRTSETSYKCREEYYFSEDELSFDYGLSVATILPCYK